MNRFHYSDAPALRQLLDIKGSEILLEVVLSEW